MVPQTLPRRVDLLSWPAIGPFLRWRHARTALQVPLLLLAGLAIFDGLAGPQLAPKNLATVGVWLLYRGLVVLALAAAGNLFCLACPFMLPRHLGWLVRRRLGGSGRTVPAILRNKWPAVGLILLFFFLYERFSLWSSPRLTAWIALGYFGLALVTDTVFRGAAFCKHLCPLGQFNFFGALNSPLEVQVRRAEVCAACRTKDCIRIPPPAGRTSPSVRGCELWLFQERKVGNMDCTFCLDCVHACPYDNVGVIGRLPTAELWHDPFRSGIGRFSRRPDLAAMVAIFVFGSFINAFAMIRPVYALRSALAGWLGVASPTMELAVIFLLGLIILPAALLTFTGLLSRALSGRRGVTLISHVGRYVYALVPLGFGMWLAHYSFHLLTGGLTVVPVVQSFLADVGLWRGEVRWDLGPLVPGSWLFPIEAFFMYAGAFGSLIAAFQIARSEGEGALALGDGNRLRGGDVSPAGQPQTTTAPLGRASEGATAGGRVLGAALPWMVLCLALLGFGLWILIQPMEMRGTMLFARPAG